LKMDFEWLLLSDSVGMYGLDVSSDISKDRCTHGRGFVSRLVSNAPARRMRARFIQSFSTVIKNLSVLIETHTAAILPSAEVCYYKVSKQTLKYFWPN
jgi:hypothetical protein